MNESIRDDDYVLTLCKEDYELGELVAPSFDEKAHPWSVLSHASNDSINDADDTVLQRDDIDTMMSNNSSNNRDSTSRRSSIFERSIMLALRKPSAKSIASKGVLARARKQVSHTTMKMLKLESSTKLGNDDASLIKSSLSDGKKTVSIGKNLDVKPENIIITCVTDVVSKHVPVCEKHKKHVPVCEKIVKSVENFVKIEVDDIESGEDVSNEEIVSKEIRKSKKNTDISKKSQQNAKAISPIPTYSPYEEFFKDARFFMIKSCNEENVILSKVKGVWATTPRNERLLNKAYRHHRNVILIFSVERSQAYQGFCRMLSESSTGGMLVNWVLPRNMNARALGGVFRVQWLNRSDLPFSIVTRLNNPWNDGKPVKVARDGTEVEPKVAEQLCRQFSNDASIDMHDALTRLREGRTTNSQATVPITHPMTPPLVAGGAAVTRLRRDNGGDVRRTTFRRQKSPLATRRSPPRRMQRRLPPPKRFSAAMSRQRDERRSPPSSGFKDLVLNGSYTDYMRQYSNNAFTTGANSFPLFSSLPTSCTYTSADQYNAMPMYMNYMTGSSSQYLNSMNGARNGSSRINRVDDFKRSKPVKRGGVANFDWRRGNNYRRVMRSPSPIAAARSYRPNNRRRDHVSPMTSKRRRSPSPNNGRKRR